MSYYDEVFLKRMNKDGRTPQERIKTRKEKEFDLIFLKRTEYQVLIYGLNEEPVNIIGSLQPNSWNESKLISNLLISTKVPSLHTGDVLNIKQKIKEQELDKIWLVLFVEENITKGYQLFKCICLDSYINITDMYGNTIKVIPVKFVSAAEKFVQDSFSLSNKYREPSSSRTFIAADDNLFQKELYFNYKEKGWEIQSKDNLSIDNVAYVSVAERLVEQEEPLSSQEILVGDDTNFFLNGGGR